jgi:hypothetical protein
VYNNIYPTPPILTFGGKKGVKKKQIDLKSALMSNLIYHYEKHIAHLEVKDASIILIKALARGYHSSQDVFVQGKRGKGCQQPTVTCIHTPVGIRICLLSIINK